MQLLQRHSTGLTIAWVVVLAVGLSFLPLSDALRPLPELRPDAIEALLGAILARGPQDAEPEHGSLDEARGAAQPHPLRGPLGGVPEPPEHAAGVAPAGAASPPNDERALDSLGVTDQAAARSLEELRQEVGARHVDIEQGCHRPGELGCAAPALAPFFEALDGLHEARRRAPVRVVHLGDSLIASDHISDLVRQRLQLRHGAGGTGFLFADRPTRFSGRAVRSGVATAGWRIDKLTDGAFAGQALGLTGVSYSAEGRPQTTRMPVGKNQVAEIFFLTLPRGGYLDVHADDQRVGRIFTRFARSQTAFSRLRLPAGARQLTVSSVGGPVQLYGVSLETGGPGVVYDSLGLPGATARILLRATPSAFRDQLARRAPSLVVVMLGGNEAFEKLRGRAAPSEIRESFDQLLRRIHSAAPGAACLLASPLDAGLRTLGASFTVRPHTQEIAAVIRRAALDAGCAFWDMLAAMGGEGAVRRWVAAGLMSQDLVHPRAKGADLLGHLFDLALERAYLEWQGPRATADAPGLEVPPGALERTFSKLRRLEAAGLGRVAVAQLGASHTASHLFTDAVRERLARRFGDGGRGYVATGRPSRLLAAAGVQRALSGEYQVLDAVTSPAAALWGLTGTRTELSSGASAEVSFCTDCSEGGPPSRLDVFLLERAGMGRPDLLLDGALVPAKAHREGQEGVLVLSLAAPTARSRLQVRNAGPGPLSVLGVASELDRPGVVYDALGLPGATVWTLTDFEQRGLEHQLAARRPDLYVLFFGTNESGQARISLEEMRARYASLFSTLRAAAPGAECVFIGPTDRQGRAAASWAEAPSLSRIVPALRSIAREQGCAFWSARAAMGGRGAIARWLEREPPLALPDRVHLTPEGYRILANAFADDLLAAYQRAREEG